MARRSTGRFPLASGVRRSPMEQGVAGALRKFAEGRLGVHLEIVDEAGECLLVERPVAVRACLPWRQRPGRQREVHVGDDEILVELLDGPEAVAGRAGPVGAVETKETGRKFLETQVAADARVPLAVEGVLPVPAPGFRG